MTKICFFILLFKIFKKKPPKTLITKNQKSSLKNLIKSSYMEGHHKNMTPLHILLHFNISNQLKRDNYIY